MTQPPAAGPGLPGRIAPGAADPGGPPGGRGTLVVVFTTVLIDFAGFGVLIPVLPLYADRLGASAFEVGLLVTVYALAQLLFLPAWGWLSDRVGRRPVLLASLAGTVAAYVWLATATSLEALYGARVLAGFFAAAVGTAQAVVTDVTPPDQRARGMGLVGASMGLAIAIGPAVGGLLGAVHERLPFTAVAAVAAANLVLGWILLPETRPPREEPVSWGELGRTLIPAPLRLVGAVHDRRIGLYLYLFFHVALGFAALESLLPVFLEHRFGASAVEIGGLFAVLGLFMILIQGLLVGPLVRRFRESSLVTVGLAACGAGLASIAWMPGMGSLYAVAPVVALGYGLAWPTFTSLFSQACAAREAGELLGQSQSMATTGRVLGPVWAGLVMDHGAPGLTFVVAGALMLSALVLFLAFRRLLARGH